MTIFVTTPETTTDPFTTTCAVSTDCSRLESADSLHMDPYSQFPFSSSCHRSPADLVIHRLQPCLSRLVAGSSCKRTPAAPNSLSARPGAQFAYLRARRHRVAVHGRAAFQNTQRISKKCLRARHAGLYPAYARLPNTMRLIPSVAAVRTRSTREVLRISKLSPEP